MVRPFRSNRAAGCPSLWIGPLLRDRAWGKSLTRLTDSAAQSAACAGEGTSVAQHAQRKLIQPGGFPYHVNFGDLASDHIELEHQEQPSLRSDDHPHGAVHEGQTGSACPASGGERT